MSVLKSPSKTTAAYEVTFRIPAHMAQGATTVYVLGDFNEWRQEGAEMEYLADGTFSKAIELPAGHRYEFRYMTDGGYWFNDDQADGYVPSYHNGFTNAFIDLPGLTIAKEKKKPAKPKKAAEKDKLTKIEGIGPKIAVLLNAREIHTFADLANTEVAVLEEILRAAGPRYRMHKPGSWPRQAKLAAAGDWDALKALQDKLDGGR